MTLWLTFKHAAVARTVQNDFGDKTTHKATFTEHFWLKLDPRTCAAYLANPLVVYGNTNSATNRDYKIELEFLK